jgi:uncharacterized NAD(P)/FAD-binding protein YdhS
MSQAKKFEQWLSLRRRRRVVAVVGGGSVATTFLRQLVEQLASERQPVEPPPAILVFEPRARIGAGQAYEDDFACNLLNTRADTMSAVHGEPHHFLRWLTDHEDNWRHAFPEVRLAAEEFLPRPLFGRYLEALYEETIARALGREISVTQVRDCVTDLLPIGERVCLDTASGQGYEADIVVLATGNMPSVAFPELVGAPGFFNTPYPGNALPAAIPPHAPVAVIGTNLSAIDTVIALCHGGHQGKVVCVSRHGRLPSVRGINNKKHRLQFLTRETLAELGTRAERVTLEDIAELLAREVEAVQGSPPDLKTILNAEAGTYDYLSTEIDESAASRAWQSVVYATNGIIEHIWHTLDAAEKRRFIDKFRSQWFSYRVSFPLANAQKIRELMRRDRMLVFGGFEGVRFDRATGRFHLSLRDTSSGLETNIATSFLVNATSYSTDVNTSTLPLVRNLLKRGLAVPNEFGGFEQEFETGRVRDRTGSARAQIYALGALATGTYFWTNAMDVNTRLSFVQASVIAGTLTGRGALRLQPRSPRRVERALPPADRLSA